jgi:putative ABC transport system permease protein
MSDTLRDLRLAFRSLRARPLFLATAVATLGLGIGASTGVFSVIQAALLRPLPFEDADRLMVVWGVAGPERDIRGASPIEIRDWDGMVDALGPLTPYNATTFNLSGEGEAAQLRTETVGHAYFEILGVSPARGRTFTPEDDRPGATQTAVISDALWTARFGGDPRVIGRTVRLDGLPVEVIGVMPPGFRGLAFDTDAWLPLGAFLSTAGMEARGGRWLAAVGRLADGRTAEEAESQLAAAAARLEELYPDSNRERGAMVLSLRDFYVAQTRPLLLMVLGGVGLLLLIACANVANLQIVRGLERSREVALRHALGGGRRRVARQLLSESVVLGLLGALAGLVLAGAGIALLLPLIPAGVLPAYAAPGIDLPVLGFCLVAGIGTAAVFGLLPAVRAARQHPASALRGTGRGITEAGRAGRRPGAQQAIVAAEVALALVLLVGAGLALRSVREQLTIEPGFVADDVLAARVALPSESYDAEGRRLFVDRMVEGVRDAAGVAAAEVVSNGPLRGYNSASMVGVPERPDRDIRYYRHSVTPGFFDALGISVRGRAFTTADGAEDDGVVVISEAMAARLWPGEEALGRRLLFGMRDTATVIGVAANVRYRDLTTSLMDPGEDPDVYFAYAQVPTGSFDVLLKTAGDPATFTAVLRRRVAALDPALPLFDVAPMRDVLAAQTALGRMVSTFLTVFGALALLVAAVGLYGVLAYVVRGRRREIAIRQALGAPPAEIRRMIVGQGVALVGAGVIVGLGAALLTGRMAAGLLYGVRAVDPVVLVGTTAALLLIAAVASWLPARQATGIAPHTAMASE